MQFSVPVEFAQGCRWYLVHTRSNGELKTELNLERQGFTTFLPRVEKTIRHARRFKAVRRPLFPRYLFVRLDIGRDRWLSVNSTLGVSRLFAREGQPVAVPFGVVETLQAHSEAGLMRLDRLLAEGQRVRILSGPLADFRATVLRFGSRQRVDVLLEMMGATVPVSMDRRALARAA
jgi:transcriptional antiterminator RfaH